MAQQPQVIGFEINPKFVGAMLTEQVDRLLRVFCFYLNGEIASFDLPAEENQDNLRHFFTRLNMEETCSSLIIDEVVQGRFYVRAPGEEEQYWLYTLLSSPGNIMTVDSAQICRLPWRVCWRSQEAEVLECGKPGDTLHCFAIRTTVTQGDADRLLKQSKAFRNPIVLPGKRSHKKIYLGVGVGLACLVLPMALTFFCLNKSVANVPPPPALALAAKAPPAPPAVGNYYLLSDHQISGPFPVKTIAAMQAAGQIKNGTLCRAENASEWGDLADLALPLVTK